MSKAKNKNKSILTDLDYLIGAAKIKKNMSTVLEQQRSELKEHLLSLKNKKDEDEFITEYKKFFNIMNTAFDIVDKCDDGDEKLLDVIGYLEFAVKKFDETILKKIKSVNLQFGYNYVETYRHYGKEPDKLTKKESERIECTIKMLWAAEKMNNKIFEICKPAYLDEVPELSWNAHNV